MSQSRVSPTSRPQTACRRLLGKAGSCRSSVSFRQSPCLVSGTKSGHIELTNPQSLSTDHIQLNRGAVCRVDRRYSTGTLSAFLDTPANRASDVYIAKSGIADSYADDLAALRPDTREMLTAFAAGVNAWIAATESGSEQLPPEYAELNLPKPKSWTEQDSLAVFKGRHLTMSNLGNKLARWKTLHALGAEKAGAILAAAKPALDEANVILKDGLSHESAKHYGQKANGVNGHGNGTPDLSASLPDSTWSPGFTPTSLVEEFEALRATISNDKWGAKWAVEDMSGSNCWVVDGRWTKSGEPLMGGDPHRQVG